MGKNTSYAGTIWNRKKNRQLQWVVANMYVILKQKWVPTMIYKMFNTRIIYVGGKYNINNIPFSTTATAIEP